MAEVQTLQRRKPRRPFKHHRASPVFLERIGVVDESGAVALVGGIWFSLKKQLKPVVFGRYRLYRVGEIESALRGEGAP